MADEKKNSEQTEKKTKAAKSAKKDSKPKKSKKKKNPFKSIANFFKSVRAEGKKVVWPKGAEVFRNTLVVLLVCVVVGVCIYIVDTGLSQAMKGIKSLAPTTTTTEVSDTDSTDTDDTDSTEADDTEETDSTDTEETTEEETTEETTQEAE